MKAETTLTQVLFQCPLCGEEYTYFTEAGDCVHSHLHSWWLVQTELRDTIELDVSNPISIMNIKDTLMGEIKLVMYEIDRYGRRSGIVYETTVEGE